MKREARARRLSPRAARRLASPLAARARLTHMSPERSALQNDALVQPELQRLRDELGGVEDDFARAGEAFDRDTQRKRADQLVRVR